MPTDAECLAFWNEQHAKGIGALHDRVRAIHEKWPVRADHMAYYNWSRRRADNEMAQEMVPVPREDLATMISTMNYNRDTDRGKLVNALERTVVAWIPVGSYRGGGIYRIISGAYEQDPKTDRELVSDNVPGVNTNVQPRIPLRSRRANFLEFWGDEAENFRSYEDAAGGPWLPTGFCAAIRFGNTGTTNGVYIIYDFYPTDDFGERDLKTDRNDWGQLPEDRSNQQFSIAKNC
ncbi:MAG: hypothetical protein M1813_005423 [Trichoglossum hirsutum]|nr:MAG: hypothetical protein M1813_005423 [Trichoglossum hirsutum]